MIATLLVLPVILACMIILFRERNISLYTPFIYSVIFLVISVSLYIRPAGFTAYFAVDNLNIWFLLILAVVFAAVALYNIEYERHSTASRRDQALFSVNILLFVASMTGVILSTHLALLWVFVEATTLTSALPIYHSRSESSLEAVWKYLFICSIGISMAFVGIIFLSSGLKPENTLFFADLYANAKSINPFWISLAFPFILAGFGTKAGLAPMHAWLPDAHSESPSPISALLSGTLLNSALLGIVRFIGIMDHAGMGDRVRTILLITGFISLFVTSVYIMKVRNFKRMLAYSSIENMGITVIGIGLGGPGVLAALIHLAGHSFTKASFFLTSGNILHGTGQREIDNVRGLLSRDPATGWLWVISFISMAGIPPFPIFLSEFIILTTMFTRGMFSQAVLFMLLLTIIMAGMGRAVMKMAFGKPDSTGNEEGRSGIIAVLPQVALIAILLVMGIAMPDAVMRIIERAVSVIQVQG